MSRQAEYAQAFASEHHRPVRTPSRYGIPEWRPYRWRHDWQQPAWVLEAIAAAQERAREIVRAELRAGAWWIPRGFTEADLDAIWREP